MTTMTPPLSATLVAIRAAHHAEATPAYDRVVFEFTGALPLLHVEYVPRLVADASGLPVPVIGNAILQIQCTGALAHDDHGHGTAPAHLAVTLPMVKDVVRAGDFEGVVTYGIGVSQRVYTRISTLAAPHRIVIDFLQA